MVPVDEIALLAEQTREGGAVSAPVKEGEDPGAELLKKLLKGSRSGEKEDGPGHDVVHLVENLPPLPKRMVDLIVRGSFVEFALFPMLEDGPCEGEWRSSLGDLESPGQSSSGRKKGVKEVPDTGWWGTCFTLYQAAWVGAMLEMFGPLSAYREIVARLARSYQWNQVAKYDRAFRKLAAGKGKTFWLREEASLVRQYLSGHEIRQAVVTGGSSQRRPNQRKRGACFNLTRAVVLAHTGLSADSCISVQTAEGSTQLFSVRKRTGRSRDELSRAVSTMMCEYQMYCYGITVMLLNCYD